MKRTLIAGMAICLLLGSISGIFAQAVEIQPPVFGGFGNLPGFRPPEMIVPEINRMGMAVYEQFGLVFNDEKGGYSFDGKLVGLLVDRWGRGISRLNQNSEIHIKAVRDSNGNLTGLAELSSREYSEVVAEIDSIRTGMERRMENLFAELQLRHPSVPGIQGNFSLPDLEEHMNGIREKIEQHMRETNERFRQRMN